MVNQLDILYIFMHLSEYKFTIKHFILQLFGMHA